MQDSPKKRGRPRSFDDTAALERATETFLQLGYSGATLEALTSAMGVNRPSFYGAFGDKRSLFLLAVEALAAKVGQRLSVAFLRGDSLESALREMFLEAVDVYLGGEVPPGCLIVSGTTTEAVHDEGLAQFTREFHVRTDRLVAKGIERYLAKSKRASDRESVSVIVLARLANGVIHDLALRARVGQSRKELQEYARGAAIVIGRGANE